MSSTTPGVAGLVERVEILEGTVVDLVDALTARRDAGPWLWAAAGRDRQVELWHELGEFVAYLQARYLQHLPGRDHHLPPCWYHHPVAVELLTALMVAHRGAYHAPAADPSPALVDFHERALWPTLERLRALRVFSACDDGAHSEQDWRTVPWHPDEAFYGFVAENLPTDQPLPPGAEER